LYGLLRASRLHFFIAVPDGSNRGDSREPDTSVRQREIGARQLERRGIGFERYQNTFLSIDDLPLAQRLCASFTRRRWNRLFDAFARRINPWLPIIRKHDFGSYYWCIDACEVSTDLMWRDRPSLLGVLDDLFDHALRAFSADDVVRFLGLKCRPQTGELETRHARRPEGRRIKHRIRQNWLKLYDKWSVLRVETVINNPTDIGVARRIKHLGELGAICRSVNRRILDVLRVASAPDLSTSLFEQVALPDGRAGSRTVALRYGDPRVMALMAALTLCLHQVQGLTNKSLRPLVATLLGSPYGMSNMSYDLWRLRTNGLIGRIGKTHTYVLTPKGIRVCLFYTKTYRRIIDPLFAAAATGAQARAAPELRDALRTIDRAVSSFATEARVAA